MFVFSIYIFIFMLFIYLYHIYIYMYIYIYYFNIYIYIYIYSVTFLPIAFNFCTLQFICVIICVLFHANDMNEIQSDLSASNQVVSGKCIFSCNDVLKAVDKLKLHKAEGLKDYLLIILKKLFMISMHTSHFCCQAY